MPGQSPAVGLPTLPASFHLISGPCLCRAAALVKPCACLQSQGVLSRWLQAGVLLPSAALKAGPCWLAPSPLPPWCPLPSPRPGCSTGATAWVRGDLTLIRVGTAPVCSTHRIVERRASPAVWTQSTTCGCTARLGCGEQAGSTSDCTHKRAGGAGRRGTAAAGAGCVMCSTA